MGRELVGDRRPVAGRRDHVAAGDIDVVTKHERHGVRRGCVPTLAVKRHDAGDARRLSMRRDDHRIADGQASRNERAGEAANVAAGPRDRLHGEARRARSGVVGIAALQRREKRRPVVPRHVRGGRRDIVAEARGDGNRPHVADVEMRRRRAEARGDAIEDRLCEGDEIHLVDGEDDVAHAGKGGDGGMPQRLREKSLSGIDEKNGDIGVRHVRRHAAPGRLGAGGLGKDEGAAGGRERTGGDADRGVLLALGPEFVAALREIRVARRAMPVPRDRRKRILVEGAFVKKLADQRRCPIPGGAADQDAQGRRAGQDGKTQKQPSRFLRFRSRGLTRSMGTWRSPGPRHQAAETPPVT